MKNLEDVILKPLLTEKGSFNSDKYNRYAFVVRTRANKNQVKLAVEKLYDVKVVKVRISVSPGKLKRAGKKVVKSSSTKKALVDIAAGQKIEFFKGV